MLSLYYQQVKGTLTGMKLSELKAWVNKHKAQIEQELKSLVEINTATSNTNGVDRGMDMLSQIAQTHNLMTLAINGRHRLIKAGNGQRPRPRILLIAHMDTVFDPNGDFLHYEPLDDGFVRGPGVGDIKGGMVMGLWSIIALREMLGEAFDVQLVVSADEENGSPTINDWYMRGNINADYAIGLEPGFPQGELTPDVPLGVVEGRRGYGAIKFTVHGKACHSGTPELGINAVEAAAQRIIKMHALSRPKDGVTVNLGVIEGGLSPNTVPGYAKCTVSFRYMTQKDGEETKAAIEQILSEPVLYNEGLDLWDRTESETLAFIPPMEKSDKNRVLVDIVLEEAKRLGHNVVPIVRGGGSDANYISASGTPSICGMGAPAQGIHTTDEKIYLPMMFERIELLTATLYRLIQRGK